MKRQGILITLILIVIVAVAGGLIVSRMKQSGVTPVSTSIPTPTQSVQATGTSDADLEKDTQGIDTQVKALNTDAAGIDQSLNDKQGNLSEQ
ncbi:MAG: hypothetical protein NT149_03085 [Candidatus Gottesmanbacteria bacterium]|nr:hypothetical protein [Candidatus Gottesmanbacteria bacterium]